MHQLDKRRPSANRTRCDAHQLHAEEDQAEAHQRGAPLPDSFPTPEDFCEETGCNHQQAVLVDLERDNLGGHRRADIGAENDADRLAEVQEPGGDESDDEHGRHRRRLDHSRNHCAGECRCKSIGRQSRQQVFHAASGNRFERLGHAAHAVQEERQATSQLRRYDSPLEFHRRQIPRSRRPSRSAPVMTFLTLSVQSNTMSLSMTASLSASLPPLSWAMMWPNGLFGSLTTIGRWQCV